MRRSGADRAAREEWSGGDDVARLQDELDRVTRETARLLLQPGCDDAELWALDERARELRQRLRSAAARGAATPRPDLAAVRGSGGMLSGG